MAPGELLALVADDADVVTVGEHLVDLVDRYRAGGATCCRARSEAALRQLVHDVIEGVVAGGVKLERELDEGGPIRVETDRADLPALARVDHVEVAELGLAERSTAPGLLAHLEGDVSS
nr:hypothetical protein [Arenivirga flava]